MSKSLPKIIVAEDYSDRAIDRLRSVGDVRVLQDSSPETLLKELDGASALLVRTRAHVTARIIDAANELKVIARASSTVDHIDLRAARRREIHVVYSPNSAVSAMVEFAIGLIIDLTRKISYLDMQVRAGRFENLRKPFGFRIGHSTIGFAGMDPVGFELAQVLARMSSPRMICFDIDETNQMPAGVVKVDEEKLFAESDVVLVFSSLRKKKKFINSTRLEKMKPTAVLINVSKGAIVDTTALAAALESKHIGGAALDVFENEPLPTNHPIRQAPNCILTPHVAGNTIDAIEGRFDVADDVIRVLRGEAPRYPVPLPD